MQPFGSSSRVGSTRLANIAAFGMCSGCNHTVALHGKFLSWNDPKQTLDSKHHPHGLHMSICLTWELPPCLLHGHRILNEPSRNIHRPTTSRQRSTGYRPFHTPTQENLKNTQQESVFCDSLSHERNHHVEHQVTTVELATGYRPGRVDSTAEALARVSLDQRQALQWQPMQMRVTKIIRASNESIALMSPCSAGYSERDAWDQYYKKVQCLFASAGAVDRL
eukprot:3752280-Amphidinium_carterae.2